MKRLNFKGSWQNHACYQIKLTSNLTPNPWPLNPGLAGPFAGRGAFKAHRVPLSPSNTNSNGRDTVMPILFGLRPDCHLYVLVTLKICPSFRKWITDLVLIMSRLLAKSKKQGSHTLWGVGRLWPSKLTGSADLRSRMNWLRFGNENVYTIGS